MRGGGAHGRETHAQIGRVCRKNLGGIISTLDERLISFSSPNPCIVRWTEASFALFSFPCITMCVYKWISLIGEHNSLLDFTGILSFSPIFWRFMYCVLLLPLNNVA